MQLFSAEAKMFSIFFFFFFAHKKLKKPPSKVAHNRPKHFIPQPSPSHSQQPKIDFSCHKNVPPSVCSLVCGLNITSAQNDIPTFSKFLQKKVSKLDKRNFLHLLNECRGLTTWFFQITTPKVG